MALQHSEHSSSDVEVLPQEAVEERLLAPVFSPGFNFRGNFGGMLVDVVDGDKKRFDFALVAS